MSSSTKNIVLTIGVFIFLFVSLLINTNILLHQSLRLDEAQSLWAATKSVSGIMVYMSHDVQLPLYEIMLHFWIQIFGNNVVTARILSFIFFMLTLPALYILARTSSDKKIAILTVMLYSLSPFIMWYSSEARMYTLLTFVTVVSHIYFLKIIKSNGKNGIVGYFFSSLFGLYSHYFFIFLLAAQALFLVVYLYLEYSSSKQFNSGLTYFVKDKKNIIASYLISLGCAIILFLPWILYFVYQGTASNTQPLIPTPTSYNLFQTIANFLFGFQTQYIQSALVSLWPLILIPIFFLFTKRRRIQLKNSVYFMIVTFLPIIFVFVISLLIKPIYLSRYLIFVIPTLFILLSWGIINFSRQASGLLISTTALVMFAFLFAQNVSNATPVKENYKQAVAYLETHATSQDIILVSAPFTIYPIEYYYNGYSQIQTIPIWNVYSHGSIPAFSQKALVAQINSYRNTYNNMFVVLSYNQGYEQKIIHYMDTHYKREKLVTFSPGLEMREYKLRYD